MRLQTRWMVALFAAAGALLGSGRAEAKSVLLSGPVSESLTSVRAELESMGESVTRVAPANFAGASFAGYDAIWLNSARWASDPNTTFPGLASRKQDLIDFVQRGGNLLVEARGQFSANAGGGYPFGDEVTS